MATGKRLGSLSWAVSEALGQRWRGAFPGHCRGVIPLVGIQGGVILSRGILTQAKKEMAGRRLSDGRRGRNTRHVLSGLLRQSVFGRLAGYDDVNDADGLPEKR
jgi:hypothetical protein